MSALAVPQGFEPVLNEAFMTTVGPLYTRRSDVNRWEVGVLALPRHANRYGTVHGGMLATVVDYAVGLNLIDEDGEEPVRLGTVSLNIDFVSAGRLGEWLQVVVQVDKAQGRLRFCSCTMHANDSRLVLRASGVFSASVIPTVGDGG